MTYFVLISAHLPDSSLTSALREAETVSEPARRVRTLWKHTDGEMDPEPLLAPTPVYLPWLPLQEESSAVVRRRRVSIYP